MKINLNTPVVENREQRLGTIIAWDNGNASKLLKELAVICEGWGAG